MGTLKASERLDTSYHSDQNSSPMVTEGNEVLGITELPVLNHNKESFKKSEKGNPENKVLKRWQTDLESESTPRINLTGRDNKMLRLNTIEESPEPKTHKAQLK